MERIDMDNITYTQDELKKIKKLLQAAVKQNDWDYIHDTIDYIDEHLEFNEDDEL